MKKASVFLVLVSSSAMAASIPSILPDGKYTLESVNVTISKNDDATEISRNVTYQSGSTFYLTSGETTTIKSVYTIKGDNFTGTGEDFTQSTLKSVGENQFEESSKVTSTFSYEEKDGIKQNPPTQNGSWVRTFTVQGQLEINSKVKTGDQPETPGRSETLTNKNADGSLQKSAISVKVSNKKKRTSARAAKSQASLSTARIRIADTRR